SIHDCLWDIAVRNWLPRSPTNIQSLHFTVCSVKRFGTSSRREKRYTKCKDYYYYYYYYSSLAPSLLLFGFLLFLVPSLTRSLAPSLRPAHPLSLPTFRESLFSNVFLVNLLSLSLSLSRLSVCLSVSLSLCVPGKDYSPPPFKEHDFNHAPKFTQPLLDRSVVAGYTTKLSCSVRGNPKPKIVWMKNKMDLSGDPKFLMRHNEGVLTLQIRKPSTFDGGKYTCKAINDLGEDEVECKLEVRMPQ
uniref:Myosin-binding protein C, fast-type-like n=1 Tax=Callorhinchus milii TaxID=7868 RepID=A0A4W3K349_CALMI